MHWIKSALVLLLALSLPGTGADKATIVPFTITHSLLLVRVTVDGEPKTLVFDTGAERTVINDSRMVERQVLVGIGDKAFKAFVVYGPISNYTTQVLKSIKADGMLGQDILHQFRRVRVDYTESSITLD